MHLHKFSMLINRDSDFTALQLVVIKSQIKLFSKRSEPEFILFPVQRWKRATGIIISVDDSGEGLVIDSSVRKANRRTRMFHLL